MDLSRSTGLVAQAIGGSGGFNGLSGTVVLSSVTAVAPISTHDIPLYSLTDGTVETSEIGYGVVGGYSQGTTLEVAV